MIQDLILRFSHILYFPLYYLSAIALGFPVFLSMQEGSYFWGYEALAIARIIAKA